MAGGIISNLMYAVGFKINSDGVDEADSKVKILTKSFIGMGAVAGSALVGLGVAAYNAASDFENAMSQVQLATGQTEDQMLETKEIAKNLYNQNFGENWEDLGESITAVAKATQLSGDALENASREAMLYASTFGGEVDESIAAVKVGMDNFGVSSTEAYNLLTQGQQKGLDRQGDLLDSVTEYSQAFASMGFDMEDTLAYMDNGMKAGARSTDLLGDAMNEFSILSIEAGGTAANSFKALGLDSDKMMQTFATGGPAAKQAFNDIVSMISDIKDPVQQNTIGIGLFGTMFEELGVKAFSALDDVNTGFNKGKDSIGALNNGFTTVGEGMEYFRRHIETGVLIPIGEKLLPYFNKFATWISSHQPQIEAFGATIGNGLGAAIEKVSGWIQQIIPYVQQFSAAFMSGLETLWPIIQGTASDIYDITTGVMQWEGFVPVVGGVVGAFAAYKAITIGSTIWTKSLTLAQKLQVMWTNRAALATKALNLVMKLNMFGLIVSIVIGLGIALVTAYKKSEKFRDIVNGVGAAIKIGFGATMNFFKVTVPKIFNNILAFVKKWGLTALMIITGPIGLIVGFVIKNWDKIKSVTTSVFTAVWDRIKSIWDRIKSGISTVITTIVSSVSNAWNNMISTYASIGKRLWSAITKAWDAVKSAISTAMEAVKTTVSTAWDSVVSAVTGVGTRIQSALTSAWDGVKSGVISAINWIIDKVNDLIGGINDKLSFSLLGHEIDVNIPTIPPIPDGSHANGLARVPWDGYIAELHEGERVLTADENKRYTPEQTATARVANGTTNKLEVSVKLDVSGTGPSNMDTATEARFLKLLQDTIESSLRRMGLEGG